jgi:hypothetical protein
MMVELAAWLAVAVVALIVITWATLIALLSFEAVRWARDERRRLAERHAEGK